MIAKEMLLTSEEQDLLASAVGSVWGHYGAQAALDDGRYALVDMYVQTESGALTIAAKLQELDLEGGLDEYARIEVQAGVEGSAAAWRSGSVFFHEQGRTVTGVLVVRDVVYSTRKSRPRFEFVAGVGIVFVLDEGAFAVCLGGPFASDLILTRVDDMESLQLSDTSADWGENIMNQFDFEREFISLTSPRST